MKYHFKIHQEKKILWAECLELNGCQTQGNSISDLLKSAEEALNLYLDEPENSEISFPAPKQTLNGKNVFEVSVHPKIAFALMLRQERRKCGLTQSQVAKQLGIKNIYSYQRLESTKKANPELLTLSKLKKVFPNFDIDMALD